jgi:UDP-4-amino-4,6-dideoxy-N-acetyl-beta-L-altrosamine transaminase
MIPYARQSIDQADIEEVTKVLKSDFLTQGSIVNHFEKEVSKYVGAKFAVAVNSGTSALHISCLALGLEKGDFLWTSPISFVASSNCALYCGAYVDFVDIDPNTYNMCTQYLEQKLINAKLNNNLPKILIAVHLAGQSCDMEKIYQLSLQYGFKIIEDASHAIGSKYKNNYVGCGDYSDITVFSFHPVKIITTAEGGMIVTNSKILSDKSRNLSSHGINKNISLMKNKNHGEWYYEQNYLGFNYRLNEIQAALGLSQLKKIDIFIKKRNDIAKFYNNNINNPLITLPWQSLDSYSSFHLYIIRLKKNKSHVNHKDFFKSLRNNGINVNLHYIPIYKHPYYKKFKFNDTLFPETEKYYREAISIPMYFDLSQADQEKVVEVIDKILKIKNSEKLNE